MSVGEHYWRRQRRTRLPYPNQLKFGAKALGVGAPCRAIFAKGIMAKQDVMAHANPQAATGCAKRKIEVVQVKTIERLAVETQP